MAVPNLPFWLSVAHAEFGSNRWASHVLSLAGVPAPRNCSALAGKSAVIVVNLPGGALNDVNVLSYVSGTAGKTIVVNVPANAAYRSTTTGGPALRCVIPDAKSVTLNIASGATVWGKGGNGGNSVVNAKGSPGGNGGPGLYISGNVSLANSGSVLGGGGGGGGGGAGGVYGTAIAGGGGGGGCSTGAGGRGTANGGNASTTSPGAGQAPQGVSWGKGGNGGAAGQPGQAGGNGSHTTYTGGAGGAAGPAVVTV